MNKEFRVKKENLKKLVPVLLERNLDFSVRCSGKLHFFTENKMNGVAKSDLGDTHVAISLDMTGGEFHRLLQEVCGKENVDSWF